MDREIISFEKGLIMVCDGEQIRMGDLGYEIQTYTREKAS